MSVFSILRRARQAKEQPPSKPSEKQIGKQREDQATPRYVHVPTHAAADAMMGAPAGWMRDDPERIRENNLKRNAMAAAAALPGRLQRSESSAMLSPLHINMHASTSSGGVGSSNGVGSSSGSGGQFVTGGTSVADKRASTWSRSHSTGSLRRLSSTPGTPATFSPPNFSSLDAELDRARITPLETSQSGSYISNSDMTASVSSVSSSPRSSPSSSPSTSPSTCSTPSFGPSRNSKSKDDNYEYLDLGDVYRQYDLSSTESFEMTVLPSRMPTKKTIRNCTPNSSIRIVSRQHDIPSTGIQERRRQRNPYAQPVRIEEPGLRLHSSALSRSSTERTLVPPTIRSPRSPQNLAPTPNPNSSHDAPESENTTPKKLTLDADGFAVQSVSGTPRKDVSPPRQPTGWPLSAQMQTEGGFF